MLDAKTYTIIVVSTVATMGTIAATYMFKAENPDKAIDGLKDIANTALQITGGAVGGAALNELRKAEQANGSRNPNNSE